MKANFVICEGRCDTVVPLLTLTKVDDGAVRGVSTSWLDRAESKSHRLPSSFRSVDCRRQEPRTRKKRD